MKVTAFLNNYLTFSDILKVLKKLLIFLYLTFWDTNTFLDRNGREIWTALGFCFKRKCQWTELILKAEKVDSQMWEDSWKGIENIYCNSVKKPLEVQTPPGSWVMETLWSFGEIYLEVAPATNKTFLWLLPNPSQLLPISRLDAGEITAAAAACILCFSARSIILFHLRTHPPPSGRQIQ